MTIENHRSDFTSLCALQELFICLRIHMSHLYNSYRCSTCNFAMHEQTFNSNFYVLLKKKGICGHFNMINDQWCQSSWWATINWDGLPLFQRKNMLFCSHEIVLSSSHHVPWKFQKSNILLKYQHTRSLKTHFLLSCLSFSLPTELAQLGLYFTHFSKIHYCWVLDYPCLKIQSPCVWRWNLV